VSLISLIVALVIVGVVMYLINAYVPMDVTIKKLLNAVVIIFLILWLLQGLGLIASLNNILRIGPAR
jgi:hydrogenase-4 membrane subunit HyfE